MKISLRWSVRILVAALAALGTTFMTDARPAWAHATLLGTEPEYGAALSASPRRVVIHYDLAVEVRGAQVKLQRRGEQLRLSQSARYASPDHKDVAVLLPELGSGKYLLTWFLFGSDGDVMGGELAFTVLGSADGTAAGPGLARDGRSPKKRSFAPLGRAQDAARLVSVAALCVLIGGVSFVAVLWRPGIELRRTRIVLGAALAGALAGNAASLGLRGAAISGQSALGLFSPTALAALRGTHVGRVLTARLGLLILAIPLLVFLVIAPRRAVQSPSWWFGSVGCAVGLVATHGMLSHGAPRGPLASAADAVHLGAMAIWLGGLVILAVVLLPRRRPAELAMILPRWSHLAFDSVVIALVAGGGLLLLISPRWTALVGSSYGRFLVVKLILVGVLLGSARRARDFVWDRLPVLTSEPASPAAVAVPAGFAAPPAPAAAVAPPAAPPRLDRLSLQPLVAAVTAELCLAASILAAAAALAGRAPPR